VQACRGAGAGSAAHLALVVTAATVPFLPILANGFVLDDHYLIEANPQLADPLASFFEPVSMGAKSSNYYRPLSLLWWYLLRAVLGLGATGFHASNLLLHAASAAAVLLVGRKLLPALPALAAALLFAVHPVHVEPVAFASAGATELLPSLLFLVATAILLPARQEGGGPSVPASWRLWAAAAVAFSAMLAKESCVLFPVFAALLVARAGRGAGQRWRTLLRSVVPLGAAWAAYFALRLTAVPNLQVPGSRALTPVEPGHLVAWLAMVPSYLFFPVRLLPYHDVAPAGLLATLAVGLATLAAIVLAILLGRRRGWDAALLVGSGMLILTALPAAPLLPRWSAVFAERMLYLPSAGFCLLVGAALGAPRRWPSRRLVWGAVGAGVAVCVAGAVWSSLRSRDWRDDLTLFSRSSARDPGNQYLALGGALARLAAGETAAAEAVLRRIPWDAASLDDLYDVAKGYRAAGDREKAKLLYRIMAESAPSSAKGWHGLGSLELEGRLGDLGDREFREALRIDPGMLAARLDLAESLFRRGDLGGARRGLEEALALAPANAQVLNNLGVLAEREGDADRARAYYRRALAAEPALGEVRRNIEALSGPR
jgi:tetratricopeptide (TPR) repeat protein